MSRRDAAHPKAATAYVVVLVVLSALSLAHAAVTWRAAAAVHPGVIVGSILVVCVVGMHPLTVVLERGEYEIYLDSAVLVVLALLAAPGEALWAFSTAEFVSIILLRRPLLASVFNAAQSVVVAAVALALAGAIGGVSDAGALEAGAVFVLCVVFYTGSLLAGGVFSHLYSGKPVLGLVADGFTGMTPAIPLMVDGLGYLAVILIREAPAALALVLPPVVMVLASSRSFHAAHKDRVRMRALAVAADAVHAAESRDAVLEAVVGQVPLMLRTETVEVATSPPRADDLGIALPAQPTGEQTWLVGGRRSSGEPFVEADEQALRALVNMASRAIAHVDLLAQVRHQAEHDPLTGLPNRAALHDRLGPLVEEANRTGSVVGVVYIDLDGFKAVNDGLGHHAGDELLRQVAQRLTGGVRRSDLVVRLGGDEFCIVVPGVHDAEVPWAVAEQLRRAMHAPFEIDGHLVRVTASAGVAVAPDDGADAGALLRAADSGMYAAKRAGKDGVRAGAA